MKKTNQPYNRQQNQKNSIKKQGSEIQTPKKKNFLYSPIKNYKWLYLWIFLIALTTFISYYPTFKNEVTNWDDDKYITDNPYFRKLDSKLVSDIFSRMEYMGNYHPLAMLSLSIDYQFVNKDKDGKINPLPFHVTNLLLHIIASLLVFWFAYKLLKNIEIAVIAGIVFGVHALHVESIAWLSERKDVLYIVFFVASLIAYLYWIDKFKPWHYALAIILFVFSLLSKGQAVSLAVTLIAIDYFKERKILQLKSILDKIPFFILAIIFGILAIKAQKHGEALQDIQDYELYKRIGFAGYGFTQYILKLILPVNLSAIYPYPDIINRSIPSYYWLFMFPAIGTVIAFFYTLKRNKLVAFCIAFFVINIALLLQLIPVGSAIYADRYAYVPSIGYCILIGFLFKYLIDKYPSMKNGLLVVASVYVVILGALTFYRSQDWRSSETLWEDIIKKQPKAVVAWNNRGSTKDKAKKHAEAIEDFTMAIAYKPDYTHAFYNRGTAKKDLAKERGDKEMLKSAILDFNRAIELKADFAEAYHNRGLTKDELGDHKAAIEDFDKAIKFNTNDPNPYINRGVAKGKMGVLYNNKELVQQAIIDFNYVIANFPKSATAYSNRGLANDLIGDSDAALKDYTQAIEIDPKFLTAYTNRGLVKRKLKDFKGAIADFDLAAQISPKAPDVFYYRGLVKLDLKLKEEACNDLKIAAQLGFSPAIQQVKVLCGN